MPKKVNLNQAPSLREKVMFGAVMVGIVVAFFRFFYSPQGLLNRDAKIELEKIRPNYEAFMQLESSPLNVPTTPTTPLQEEKDTFLEKAASHFSNPPKYKETLLTDLNQKLVSRDMLKTNQLDGITLGNEAVKNDFSEFTFSINIIGGYLGIVEYISRIPQLPMLIAFNNLNIETASDKTGRLNMKLGGILYVPVPGQKAVELTPTNPAPTSNPRKDGVK
ncbi:MAG: type 4a pilus biogenesis protein PilO [Deltaproteobacteria bacterium]|nr:type 4a pilus biogenesis protein PilO [Deltaproteobacteria bacterium]